MVNLLLTCFEEQVQFFRMIYIYIYIFTNIVNSNNNKNNYNKFYLQGCLIRYFILLYVSAYINNVNKIYKFNIQ